MTSATRTSRPRCARCLRAASACICAHVRETAHRIEVLILQHPLEQHHVKGTARLLHLCLPHSRLLVGECFDAAELRALLGAGPSVLLYPPTPGPPDAPPPPAAAPAGDATRQLVVLDGTWRKSRRMLALNPALLALPRLALADPPAGGYRIRRARHAHQLSTLEATALALEQLEQRPPRSLALWAAFDGLIGQLEHRAAAAAPDRPHP